LSALTDVILPIFMIVFAGWVAGRRRMLGEGAAQALNGFVYWFALPAMLFVVLARTPMQQLMNPPFLGAFAGGCAITFLLALALAIWCLGSRPPVAVLQSMNASFANTGFMGIPVLFAAYGPPGVAPGAIGAVMMAAAGTIGGVVALEVATRSGGGSSWRMALRLVGTVLRNPLVVTTLCGIALSASGLGLPKPVQTFCEFLGNAASPGALFAIGLFLGAQPLRWQLDEVGWQVAVKLLVQPAVTYLLAITVFPMDAFLTGCAVLLAGLPGAATPFLLAQQYGHYQAPTSSSILLSTMLSVGTLFVLMLVVL